MMVGLGSLGRGSMAGSSGSPSGGRRGAEILHLAGQLGPLFGGFLGERSRRFAIFIIVQEISTQVRGNIGELSVRELSQQLTIGLVCPPVLAGNGEFAQIE